MSCDVCMSVAECGGGELERVKEKEHLQSRTQGQGEEISSRKRGREEQSEARKKISMHTPHLVLTSHSTFYTQN